MKIHIIDNKRATIGDKEMELLEEGQRSAEPQKAEIPKPSYLKQ